ncbi:MAG TPA: leucyl aminopeptidase family protein [Bacteroidales bacterium]|nr:leucyl aminopeptidase family protein [Bacteroidales bacterium]
MKPIISRITRLLPDQSLVCILGSDVIPESLRLSKTEKEFATKRLAQKEDHVFVNSYYKSTYLIRLKEGLPHHRIREDLRRTAYNIRSLIKTNNHEELVITSSDAYKGAVEDFCEGLMLSCYSFDKYKTKPVNNGHKTYPSSVLLHGDLDERDIRWLTSAVDAVWFARDLINEPVNYLNAPALAEEIRKFGLSAGLRVEILNKGKIEALKMGGLLAVNKGSVDPPVFCILEWHPENCINKNPYVLTGKGIVYDTGGLNIKTGDYMSGMKGDMAGAAVVAGAMSVIARAGLPLHVVGLIPATDNRPGGNAYTQGDIITMHNNTTVEVGNTDAEGRLILADAISYSSRYSPELIINVATLTGSAAMTFGSQAIAMMGNADDKYFSLLNFSGEDVFERVARLPFWEEYGEMLKSDVADIGNIGGREAGAITAGKFLESFTEYPFIHLDIAGTISLKKDDYYRLKEGTGTGLRLLSTFFRRMVDNYPGKE